MTNGSPAPSASPPRGRRLWLTGTSTRGRTRTRAGDSAPQRAGSRAAHVRRLWRRARRTLRRSARLATQPVTPLGWFVAAVTIAGALTGGLYGWIEGWFVAVVGALLLAVAVPFLVGSRAYRIRLGLTRPNVVAGSSVEVRVDVENAAVRPQLPAVAELPVGDGLRELAVPLLGIREAVTLRVDVPTTRRGVIPVGPLTVARQDPLGILRREVTWRDRHLLHVHPVTVPLPPNAAGLVRDLEGWASRRLTDADLSFHAVREYAPGDAVRHIHWKSTAKTGTLMVRQYEETQTARHAILFDARRDEYSSEEEFELGVSVAASLSVQAVREGRERFVASAWAPGRVRPSVDGLEELPSRTPSQLLDAWSELDAAPEARPIERLAEGLARSGRTLSIVTVVTGSRPEFARLRLTAQAFSPEVHVLVARCEALAEPRAQRLDALTVLTVGALGDLPPLLLRGAA